MLKVIYDIHMIFDTTVSVLNDSLWDPSFMFLSMGILLMVMGLEMHMVDLYFGGIFYNFQLSLVLAKFCGEDLGSYLGNKKDLQGTLLWILWVIPIMGLMLSPYASIQGLLWANDVLRGDSSDCNNPFSCENVRL